MKKCEIEEVTAGAVIERHDDEAAGRSYFDVAITVRMGEQTVHGMVSIEADGSPLRGSNGPDDYASRELAPLTHVLLNDSTASTVLDEVCAVAARAVDS